MWKTLVRKIKDDGMVSNEESEEDLYASYDFHIYVLAPVSFMY